MSQTNDLLTVRVGGEAGPNGFFVAAGTVQEALSYIRVLEDNGHQDIHALDGSGRRYEPAELERIEEVMVGSA